MIDEDARSRESTKPQTKEPTNCAANNQTTASSALRNEAKTVEPDTPGTVRPTRDTPRTRKTSVCKARRDRHAYGVRTRTGRILAWTGAGVLLSGGLLLALPVDETRCDSWRKRPVDYTDLTVFELTALRDATPVHQPPAPISAVVFPGTMAGIALPGRVVLASKTTHRTEERDALLLHELVHVEQMKRHGIPRFAANYSRDWLSGRLRGCGTFQSYQLIRYELEADALVVAASVVTWAETGPTQREQVERLLGTDLLPAPGLGGRLPLPLVAERLRAHDLLP
jgi:hypothetical protein